MLPQWTVPNNTELGRLPENSEVYIPLPVVQMPELNTFLLSGSLPTGLAIERNAIVGTAPTVVSDTNFSFVIRAQTPAGVLDRTFRLVVENYPRWTVPNNTELGKFEERTTVNIVLPLAETSGITTEVISGELPAGLRLENNSLVGTLFEVARTTQSTFVIRAKTLSGELDRTFTIITEGPDNPQWLTPEGRLPVGPNNVLFILDSSFIDFQLLATDADLPAGDNLEFFVADGAGELPPGIELTRDGRLIGVVDPLLALDVNALNAGYDVVEYGKYPFDYSIPSDNGLDTYYYDTKGYDYNIPTRTPKKLNRVYEFYVTVADNVSFAKRRFEIYVVGDDFTRADNTIMKAADGVFTADITYFRTPVWLTPADLGVKRANNFITVYLDVLDPTNVEGNILYFLETINDDNSKSELPPGMTLDSETGEIAGIVPYQPAITKEYKFTITATRFNAEQGVVTVFASFYEDAFSGTSTFRVAKLPRTLTDGLDDLQSLVGKEIAIEQRLYTVESVDGSNILYDTITLTEPLQPTPAATPLNVTKTATGTNYFFVTTLSESDKLFYSGKNLKFSDSEVYKIGNIYPYVEWKISTNSPTSYIELNEGVTGDVTTTIEDKLNELLTSNGNPAYITITGGSNITEIRLVIPATAQNRNTSYVNSLFHTSDSTAIVLTQIGLNDRILIDQTLSRTFDVGRQLSLATYVGAGFSKSFPRAEVDTASKSKTFTLRLLGEIDSAITWITDSDLGVLQANRISTLSVRAESTVVDANMKYNLVSGRLPPGLVLKQDGEIVGKVPISGTAENPGLTFFDTGTTTFDGGTTSLDRNYTFTVLARDRFGFSAVSRTFTLSINDKDNLTYSNIFVQPFLLPAQKQPFDEFINDSQIFDPRSVYRPSDPNFGIQKKLRALIYAGIETNDIATFVSATAKNHKKKRFLFGELKTAVAKRPGSNEVIYEVVYVDLIDPAKPKSGKAKQFFQTVNRSGKITVDSVKYEPLDDIFGGRDGSITIDLGGRDGGIAVPLVSEDLVIIVRDGSEVIYNANGALRVLTRDGTNIVFNATIVQPSGDAGVPWRFRYKPTTNTITADSNAIKSSQQNDVKKYISNIDNMRANIKETGESSRDFLPLWMRTAQNGSLSEIDYVLALPLVYTKPGYSSTIKNNITNSGFDFSLLNFEVDRYIIDATTGNSTEQYILFANYQFNV
jgi:hypothetical protein